MKLINGGEKMINTWYEFFEELATKIYEKYKNVTEPDRAKEFADWINKNIKNTKRFKSNSAGSLDHFDPFSFFSVIIPQADHGVDNKQQVWDSISSALNIGSLKHPMADTGLTRRSVTSNFFSWNCPPSDFNNLWEMFYIAIEYEKDRNNLALKLEFIKNFDEAKKVKQVGIPTLTMGLFWIRPQFYIPLDDKFGNYAKTKRILNLPEDIATISGDKYLQLVEEFHNNSRKTPVEFSKEAYNNSSEETEKKKRQEKPAKKRQNDKLASNSTPHTGAYNKIFYGVPGCGKSWHIENKVLSEIFGDKDYVNNKSNYSPNVFRTIFYQDYSHTDFVGQYMPKRINGQVEYTFVPKVFTKALKRAYQHPEEPVVLIIEEINRGDAASIFGDIFQLLDRDRSGKSEYEIDCDEIVDYLRGVENKNKTKTNIVGENEAEGKNKIYIASNLYLLATMNTCDQNVFALDTAFKRRWNMEEIPNEFKGHKIKDMLVPYDFGGKYITWENFVETVNAQITDKSDEFFGDDRQIGCFFVDDTCLLDNANDPEFKEKCENFAYKVISYLWNDVAKINRPAWFNDEIKTLHNALTVFTGENKDFKDLFNSELKNNLIGKINNANSYNTSNPDEK